MKGRKVNNINNIDKKNKYYHSVTNGIVKIANVIKNDKK
jgi:hypothetical protein